MTKPIAIVRGMELVCAEDFWPGEENHGKMVMRAIMVVDATNRTHRGIRTGEEFTTSPILSFDLEKRLVETKNTIYQVIPTSQKDTYLMCVPQPVAKTTLTQDPVTAAMVDAVVYGMGITKIKAPE